MFAGLQCSPGSSPSSVWPAAERFFVRRLRIWYIAAAYFNWLLAAVAYRALPARRRSTRGWLLITAASGIQLFAFGLHWSTWSRLQGQPDAVYAWVAPAGLVLVTFAAIVGAFVVAALAPRTSQPAA